MTEKEISFIDVSNKKIGDQMFFNIELTPISKKIIFDVLNDH